MIVPSDGGILLQTAGRRQSAILALVTFDDEVVDWGRNDTRLPKNHAALPLG